MSSLSFLISIFLIVLFSSTQSTSVSNLKTTQNVSQIFEDWMIEHNRVYSNPEEKAQRFQIFKASYLEIENYKKEGEKNRLYTVGLNQFSDMKREEFQSYKCRRKTGGLQTSIAMLATKGIKMVNTSSMDGDSHTCTADWTTSNVGADGSSYSIVSPVRDQGTCDACWAIASVAAAEAIIRITDYNGYQLPQLSVQQVLDCANGDHCRGGSEIDAYTYMIKTGLPLERQYPYKARSRTCTWRRPFLPIFINGVAFVNPPDEFRLRKAVCLQPVTAGIASNSPEFKNYNGGIFHGTCGKEIDHTVLVVGVGEENGVWYWKVQNSWGDKWGERGYMRLSFKAGRDCKIAEEASFPLARYL